MQTLPILVAEMRMLGIRRLDLELEPDLHGPATERAPSETEPEPAETKPDGACAYPGCLLDREGLFGGAIAGAFCRAHAFAEAGVKP